MSEPEILELVFTIFDRYWNVVQWWASVSFGLLLVAHFAAERLRLHWVVGVVVLYAVYSLWVYLLLDYNMEVAFAYIRDLSAIIGTDPASEGTQMLLTHPLALYGIKLGWIALTATYLACNGYLIYTYVMVSRRSMD
ncbi:MAG: hypothetical protein ABJK25_12330 [Halieaceae bacterium]